MAEDLSRRKSMFVRDIMRKKVDVINFEKSVLEAAEMMSKGNYGALPVEKDDKMIGMITDRDIALRVVAGKKEAASTSVFDCMTSGIQYCFDDEDVKELAQKMKKTQRHRIPVVNREKRLVGIVSSKDLATHAKDKELTQSTFERIYT
jgi:CBS domain-containing protein